MAQRADVLTLDIDVEAKEGIDGVKRVRDEVEKLARARGFEIRQAKQRKQAKRTTEELAKQRRELAKLRRTQNVAATSASRSSKSFGASFGALGRGAAQAGAAGLAIAGVGEAFRLAGAAADVSVDAIQLQAEALISATKSALEFQDGIVRVSAITGGLSKDFDILRDSARAAGASTLFTSQEATGGLKRLTQAGLDAREAVEALPKALELATAGDLSIEDAANISTNAVAAFGLAVEDLGRINDVLANTAASSNTDIKEIGVSLRLAGSAAKGAGASFEETTAILGALANAGLAASQRGRAFRSVTNAILAPTARAEALYKKYNIQLSDAAGNTVKVTEFARQLADANVSGAEISRSFSVQQAAAVRALVDQIGEAEKLFQGNLGSAGRAAEISGAILSTYQSRLTILESTYQSLSIEIGSRFAPTVAAVSDVFTDQLVAILDNNDALNDFDAIAEDLVEVLASVTRAGAVLVPMFIRLSGTAIEAGKTIGGVVEAIDGALELANPVFSLEVDDDGSIRQFQNDLTETDRLANLTGQSLTGVADGLEGLVVLRGEFSETGNAIASGAANITRGVALLTGDASALASGYAQARQELEKLLGIEKEAEASNTNNPTGPTEAERKKRAAARLRRIQREAQANARSVALEAQRFDILAKRGGLAQRIAAIEAGSRAKLASLDAAVAGKRLSDQEQQNLEVAKELEEKRALLEVEDERLKVLKKTKEEAKSAAERVVGQAKEIADKLAAARKRQQVALVRNRDLELEALKLTARDGDLRSKVAEIQLETKNKILLLDEQLALTGKAALTAEERKNVQLERAITLVRQRKAIREEEERQARKDLNARIELSRDIGAQAGAGLTGLGALSFAQSGAQRDLDSRIANIDGQRAGLASRREEAAAGGADTSLLEAQEAALQARADALRTEFELEQRNQDLLRERLEIYAQAATQAGELGAQIQILSDVNTTATEGYEAQAAAIGAAVNIASALSSAGIKGVKEQAKVQALFQGAAAIGTLAAFISTGAPNFLKASINHGFAAAKFGLVAGTGGGGAAPSASVPTASAPRRSTPDTSRINQRGRDSRASLGGGEIGISYDFSGATFLESATATQRRLMRLSDRARSSTIQLGGGG